MSGSFLSLESKGDDGRWAFRESTGDMVADDIHVGDSMGKSSLDIASPI